MFKVEATNRVVVTPLMLAISLQLVVAWDDSHQEPLHTWAVRMPNAVHGCSKHQTFIHQKLTHTRIANQFALHVFEQNLKL